MQEVEIREKETDFVLSKEFQVSFSSSILREALAAKLKEKQKSARLPGFREGQVPFFIIEKKYKSAALASATREKAESIVEEIVAPYKSRLVGRAEIKDFNGAEENIVSFSVEFELFPQFEMPDFSKVEIEHYSVEVPEKEIDEQIELLAKSRREIDSTFDGKSAKEGDLVKIDFESRVNGEIHEDGDAKDMEFELGAGNFLKDFEDNIIGSNTGDCLEFTVNFPQDYRAVPEVAGKSSIVKLLVKGVKRYGPMPKIDDEFAAKYGCKDLNEMRYRVSELIREAISRESLVLSKMRLFDQLEKVLSFDVPKSLMQRELSVLQSNQDLKKYLNLSNEEYETYCQRLALRKLRIGIMISEYAKENGVKVDDKEFQRHVLSQMEKYPDRKSEVVEYYRQNAASWYSSALEEKTVRQILAEKVKLIDVEKTSNEVRQIIEDFQASAAER